jgi:hypothetical protein
MQPLPISGSERRFCDDAGLTVASKKLAGLLVSFAVISRETLRFGSEGAKREIAKASAKACGGVNRGGAGVAL